MDSILLLAHLHERPDKSWVGTRELIYPRREYADERWNIERTDYDFN